MQTKTTRERRSFPMSASTCPAFWTEDPMILVKESYDFFPFHEGARKCTTTALNSFTRFGIYLGVILTMFGGSLMYLTISVAIAIAAMAAYYGMKSRGIIREGFVIQSSKPDVVFSMPGVTPEPAHMVKGIDAAGKPVSDVIGQQTRTEPTAANPFMNVLLTEIGDNPMRPPAENGEFLKRQFSNEFQERVYGDPSDVFQKSQNQRIWAVEPATSIPNDRDSFQNWLYRVPGRTCKEGNTRICKTGTDGGSLTWINEA